MKSRPALRPIHPARAEMEGMLPLTTPYKLPEEARLLVRALDDLERGGISHALVKEKGCDDVGEKFEGVTIWRGYRSTKK